MSLPFEDQPAMLLRAAYLGLHRAANAVFAEHGASADQFVVLTLLDLDDGQAQKDLAARAGTDANTMAAMLAVLERRELISRKACPDDRRVRRVSLTPAGRKLRAKLDTAAAEFHRRILAAVPPAERATFADCLKAIRAAAGEPPPAELPSGTLRRRIQGKTASRAV